MKLDSIHFYDFEHFYCKISSLKSKPWIRKVRTSRGHLLAEKRAIHGTWYLSIVALYIVIKILVGKAADFS